jgi:hypothetical protein
MGIIPSITGKVELVYEGKEAAYVAKLNCICDTYFFPRLLSKIEARKARCKKPILI